MQSQSHYFLSKYHLMFICMWTLSRWRSNFLNQSQRTTSRSFFQRSSLSWRLAPFCHSQSMICLYYIFFENVENLGGCVEENCLDDVCAVSHFWGAQYESYTQRQQCFTVMIIVTLSWCVLDYLRATIQQQISFFFFPLTTPTLSGLMYEGSVLFFLSKCWWKFIH